ncbi:unnamed protein product [Protopolystoma xenopodis]|uniref:Uncharacterized protein n=1 Tax=Protopolystoma xenopodis TaxID=117903 RepID=A0A3S5B8B6_9PLAT|nr:unnamed protein product [Protopolystoma xenopodis]
MLYLVKVEMNLHLTAPTHHTYRMTHREATRLLNLLIYKLLPRIRGTVKSTTSQSSPRSLFPPVKTVKLIMPPVLLSSAARKKLYLKCFLTQTPTVVRQNRRPLPLLFYLAFRI